MKKIFSVIFFVLVLFVMTSCVSKVTNDEEAMDAFLASIAKISNQNGFLMDGDFSLDFVMQDQPTNFSGNFSFESTVLPVYASKMNLDMNTKLLGMDVRIPMSMYFDFSNTMSMYVCFMGLCGYSDIQTDASYTTSLNENVKKMRSKDYLLKLAELVKNISYTKFNGITELKNEKVYDIDLIFKDKVFSQVFQFMKNDPSFSPMMAQMNYSEEEILVFDNLFKNLNIKIFLKEKDCSLFCTELDLGFFMNFVMSSSLFQSSSGSMRLFYLEGEPKNPIIVPENIKSTAVPLKQMFEQLGGM